MSQTLHIIQKDASRLRLAMFVWVLITATTAGLMVARPALDLQGFGVAIVVGQLTSLVSLIELVMMILMVSWLVHEDPAVDREAFWLTRPINPRRLSLAKVTVASVALFGVPLIGQLMVMRIFGLSRYEMAHATPSILLSQAAWVMALMAAAALTPSLTRYAILLLGSAAAFVLVEGAMVAIAVLFVGVTSSAGRPEQIDPLPGIVTSAAAITASMAIVFFQYRYRRIKSGVVLAGIAAAAIFVMPIVWPSDFRRLPDPDPGAWAHDQERVTTRIDPKPPNVSDELDFRARTELKKRIAAPVRLSGLPDDFYVHGVQATSRLDVAARTLSSVTAEMVPVRRAETFDAPNSSERTAIQGALGTVRLLESTPPEEGELWPVVLSVTAQELAQFGRSTGRLTSTLDFYLARATAAGVSPLEEGRTLTDDRRRFDIVRINRLVDRCTVDIRQISVGPVFHPRIRNRDEFVLRNTGRGEALRAGVESGMSHSSSPLGFLLGMAFGGGGYGASADPDAPGFSAGALRYRFPRADRSGAAAPVIDAAWLAGAELVRIHIAYSGHVTRSLTIENFRMSQ